MKCAIYVRVSTKRQGEEGISIKTQLKQAQQYAKKKKWKIYKKYIDPNHSGHTRNRPQLKQLLEDAIEKKFDVILVYKVDRFTRNLRDLILDLDKLADYNIDFVSITQPIDTTTSVGKAFMRIVGVFAELERDMISERVKLSMAEKAKEGCSQHRPPFGYYFRNKNLVVNKDEAKIVKKFFKDCANGINRYDISKKYNKSFQTINNILSNPIYHGVIKWNSQIIKGQHEPIIKEELFKKIQNLIKTRKKIKKYKKSNK